MSHLGVSEIWVVCATLKLYNSENMRKWWYTIKCAAALIADKPIWSFVANWTAGGQPSNVSECRPPETSPADRPAKWARWAPVTSPLAHHAGDDFPGFPMNSQISVAKWSIYTQSERNCSFKKIELFHCLAKARSQLRLAQNIAPQFGGPGRNRAPSSPASRGCNWSLEYGATLKIGIIRWYDCIPIPTMDLMISILRDHLSDTE